MDDLLLLAARVWALEGNDFLIACGAAGFIVLALIIVVKNALGLGGQRAPAHPVTDTELLLRNAKRLGLTTSELHRMWQASKLNDELERRPDAPDRPERMSGPMAGKVSSEAMR